jgi:hypothetical protein
MGFIGIEQTQWDFLGNTNTGIFSDSYGIEKPI